MHKYSYNKESLKESLDEKLKSFKEFISARSDWENIEMPPVITDITTSATTTDSFPLTYTIPIITKTVPIEDNINITNLYGIAKEDICSGSLCKINILDIGTISVEKATASDRKPSTVLFPKNDKDYKKGLEDFRKEIFKIVGDGEESEDFKKIINNIFDKLIK